MAHIRSITHVHKLLPGYVDIATVLLHQRKYSREVGVSERKVGGPDPTLGDLPQNWGGTDRNRTVPCMVLKAKAKDRRKILALSQDEFRGPRSDVTVDQEA
ncbi:hypothetical protein TNCV_2236771 [Trichonephila clavipes]|nr:hypothetical protein TNCV_2236771 [Trichonephila clavipes]